MEVIPRLIAILEGRDRSKELAHLTPEMRRDILEIIRETEPQLFRSSPERS